ncbi:PH domain-containing protein [Microbacterium terricola]|uniref:PH domain-containing protein n=1 Tax=Microbacterium terricola TaxID=344163 RepID=UPI0021E8B48E|nr:PH domain-containing protein [Microbacterium terricola]UYK39202.1 hypothetical protein OAU46_10895 [Microbacterium terricola]
MPPPSALSSRPRFAPLLSIGLPVLVLAVVVVAAVSPPEWGAWRMAAFVAAFSWYAWLLWAWPLLEIEAETVRVRNALWTWRLPLGAIAGVQSGRGLTLILRDATKVPVTAVTGSDIVVESMRNVEAYTEGGHFVRNASDVSPSARGIGAGETAAWARRIEVLLREAAPVPVSEVSRRLNVAVAAASVVVTALVPIAIALT